MQKIFFFLLLCANYSQAQEPLHPPLYTANSCFPGAFKEQRDTVKGHLFYVSIAKKEAVVYNTKPAIAIYLLDYGQVPCERPEQAMICFGTIRTLEKIMIGKKEFDLTKYYQFVPLDKVSK